MAYTKTSYPAGTPPPKPKNDAVPASVVYTGTGRHAGVKVTIYQATTGIWAEVISPSPPGGDQRTWAQLQAVFEAASDYSLP